MKKVDVVIIGSGISSLTCALLLAKSGKKVTVLEQYTKPGGYLHCFSRFGQRFDTGAHYVGAMDPGHPFHTLLKYLGIDPEELFIPLNPTGFDVLHFPEFTLSIPKGYAAATDRLVEVFPAERAAIARYFELVQRSVKFFPTYEYDDAFNEVPATDIFEVSLKETVESITRNPKLQSVFYAYTALHAVAPQDVAFGFHAIVTDSLIRSPYGLRQGGDAVADKFVAEIERWGGEVLTKKRVATIQVKDRNAREVITADGQVFSADWVISGAHPKATFSLCNNESIEQNLFPEAFKSRLSSMRESVGLFGISALTSLADLDSLKNDYFFDSSDPEKFLRVGMPGEIPSAVFMSPARREPMPGADMPVNIHAASPIEWFSPWRDTIYAKREQPYHELKNQFAENVFTLVENYRPGFRAGVKKFVCSSPLTNLHFNGSYDGSAYGIYHSMQNTGPRSLGPRTRVLNLLLTGQSCLFPGLLGAAVSGLRTSGHIIGIKPVLRDLKTLSGVHA